MNMKKIAILALSLCMIAAIAVTGTIAYFTDTDNETNVFTIGNVEIDLQETFDPDEATLLPGMDINKDVRVQNVGDYDAYVRVHLAIPTELDDGDPTFNASRNFLHWNFSKDSYADGKWSWLPTYSTGAGYKGNGAGNWNFYTDTIDGVEYNIYVATYRSILKPTETTSPDAITNVYLDATVDAETTWDENGNVVSYTFKDTKGNVVDMTAEEAENIKILVFAEGVQEEGFTDAYDALNTALGNPMATGYVSPWNQ